MTFKRVLFFAAVAVGLYLLWRWYQSRQTGGEYVEEYAEEPGADSIGGGGGGNPAPVSVSPGITTPPTPESKPPLIKAGGSRFPSGSIFAPLRRRSSPAVLQPPPVNLPRTQSVTGPRLPFGSPSPTSSNVIGRGIRTAKTVTRPNRPRPPATSGRTFYR